MTNDIVTYTNHLGLMVELNKPSVSNMPICDVVDLRPFMFQTDKGGTIAGTKDFDLTIISRSYIWANTVVNRLTADAHSSKFGVLRVNNWYLRCRCLGITNIDTESRETGSEGVYKFTAKFEAPNLLWADVRWYKYNSSTSKFYARNSTDTGWSATGASIIDIYDYDGAQYAVSMTCRDPYSTDVGTVNGNFSFDAIDLDVNDNEFASETYKINFTSAQSIKSDFLSKTLIYIAGAANGYSAMDSVPDDSDWFAAHPYAARFKIRNLQGTVTNSIYFAVHRLRGMPEWA